MGHRLVVPDAPKPQIAEQVFGGGDVVHRLADEERTPRVLLECDAGVLLAPAAVAFCDGDTAQAEARAVRSTQPVRVR